MKIKIFIKVLTKIIYYLFSFNMVFSELLACICHNFSAVRTDKNACMMLKMEKDSLFLNKVLNASSEKKKKKHLYTAL